MMKNIKKTYYYLKRNGLIPTYYAAKERLLEKMHTNYQYVQTADEVLKKQRDEVYGQDVPLISILVPAYRTPEMYLRALIDSVKAQTYPHWELVIADASEDDSVLQTIKTYHQDVISYHGMVEEMNLKSNMQNVDLGDIRQGIRYVRLEKNAGISDNTNAGLEYCSGAYTALLDHDDLLTPDALYEMTRVLDEDPILVYSDEDKCDETGRLYFDYHCKLDFNYDLFLTNNYICHFTMIETKVLQNLRFRREYDGAQDFDLFLRVVSEAFDTKRVICHIPKVLYHWRSHTGSTSENPQSKLYAYTAGKRAVQDHLDSRGISATVTESRHVGFYRVDYQGGYFVARPEVGAVVPKCKGRKYLKATFYDKDGQFPFAGLPKYFGGYMHRANLQQEVYAGETAYLQVKPELQKEVNDLIEQNKKRGKDSVEISFCVADYLHERGYICVFDPGEENL